MFDYSKQLFVNSESNSPSTPYVFILKMRPSCQTLSNALEIGGGLLSKVGGLLSNVVCISCIVYSNWAIHESPGRKPD